MALGKTAKYYKGGKIVKEHRSINRGRGGSQKK